MSGDLMQNNALSMKSKNYVWTHINSTIDTSLITLCYCSNPTKLSIVEPLASNRGPIVKVGLLQ
jgi:hypothetical protein